MQRFFNTTGYCRPDWHYMVDPLREIKHEIDYLIENKQYFLIHAPRQTGKTTLLHALARQINKEGKYICVVFSLENAGYSTITVEKAMKLYIGSLYSMAKLLLPKEELPPPIHDIKPGEAVFFEYLQTWCEQQSKSIVLLIDEIDTVWDEVLISTLRQLRNGFQMRPKAFPVSVALVGLRDIRDYKMKVKALDGEMGSGSPFNIKAKSFMLGSFSKKQVAELYSQYTTDTGQAFSDEIINLIYSYTDGQPWLVNAVANEIVVEILQQNHEAEITQQIVETAKENLIKRRDTHLDSLTDKLKQEPVRKIVQGIISGLQIESDSYNDELQYTIDLGIVTETKQGIQISNKIYSEIIPRVLNKQWQDAMIPVVEPLWFIKDGKLDMDKLLGEFQKFYRRHSDSWLDKFSYQEAGKQLLLMAYLQRIVNSGGKIDREMAYGRGRTDLTIDFGGETYILELKVKYDQYVRDEGLDQLSGYLDKAGLKHGYLILFELKSSKEITWEERINWEEIEHEWMGAKRGITIVEM